jgi:two-component system, cell cycle response regulator DivK
MNELKDKRIFIIEDDVVNMSVYTAVLERSGATIIRDFRNLDSLHLLTGYLPVDVILLDLMLRYHVSGYDIFDKLKADPQFAQIPIVAVSAADPQIEISKAKAKGFAGFIGKPIDPLKFPEQIASCIEGHPVWYSRNDLLEDM